MAEIITEQGRLRINEFGRFRTRDKVEREGRNPKTGEAITITARRVVTFSAAECTRS